MNFPANSDVQWQAPECVGSLDHAAAYDQMRAIDGVLQQYFQTEDWLRARTREILRRAAYGGEPPAADRTHVFEE
jgi:hypothetical protein